MKNSLLFASSVLFFNCSLGQIRNVVIDSTNNANEPSIAIDPKNPNHMVAGANLSNVYTSINGGLTWQTGNLSSSQGVYGDPVVIADTTGSFYYFHLSQNGDIDTWPMWADRMVCQRLDHISAGPGSWTDGGYTQPTDTPAISDKPGVAVDRKTNTLYITWTNFDRYASSNQGDSSNIFFSRSTDKGNTWSSPVRINKDAGDCSDDDPTVEGAVPCVGPHGEVFVAWASYNRILFDRSYDGGQTWLSNDVFVASVPGGWNYAIPGLNRCNGFPYTACDVSNSPYMGTIYVNWTDQRYGANNTDVWICKSSDNGDTWNAPVRVNDDTGARQQFMSSMTVDPATGFVYVVFYDRRNYADTSVATDVYLAVSKDGGETFQNFKISAAPFRPNTHTFFGDYTFISAFSNVVRPVWGHLDGDGSPEKIITAIIDSTITGTAVPQIESHDRNVRLYPNPFSTLATLSYDIPEPEEVSIFVTDISERKVAVLKNNELIYPGTHTEQLSAGNYGLADGLYFLYFRTPTYSQTLKMIVKK